jgi:SHS2 domain-containing protein
MAPRELALVPKVEVTRGGSFLFRGNYSMGKDYKILEHSADVGLKAFGETKEKLFENAARGMFFIITRSSGFAKQENEQYWNIKCEGSNLEELLVAWLSELLYIHSTDFVFFNDFIIKVLTNNNIQAQSRGLKINESPYIIEKEIKAVTYHNLQVIKNKKGYWEATIVFDI